MWIDIKKIWFRFQIWNQGRLMEKYDARRYYAGLKAAKWEGKRIAALESEDHSFNRKYQYIEKLKKLSK